MRIAALAGLLGCALLAACAGTSQKPKAQPERAAEINRELAIDYLRKGNLQQAKDKIDRALEQNPRDGKAHTVAAMLYDRLGDADKAESHFGRAMTLDSENPEARNNYAAYLCQHNKFERGEKLALEAAANALYKTPEVAFVNAGNCARGAGALARAEESYRKALNVKPRFAEGLYQMADLEFRQGEYLSARGFLERYLAVARSNAAALWLAVRIERGLGNKAQAQQYAQRLKDEYPNAAQTQELLESERNPG